MALTRLRGAGIAANAITAAAIAPGAVDSTDIADGAIITAKIADANITTAKIADANITTAKIADANITTGKIADVNITTAKIADDSIDLAGTKVTGILSVSRGGTGANTLTANNVIIGNGTSAVNFVAPGTSGNVLASDGTTWTSTEPAAGGSLVFLSEIDATTSATVDLETGFSSEFDKYIIYGVDIFSSVNAVRLSCRFKIDGTFRENGYNAHLVKTFLDEGAFSGLGSGNQTSGNLTESDGINSSLARAFNFKMDIIGTTANSFKYVKSFGMNTSAFKDASATISFTGGAGVLSGIRFLLSSGNITGKFRLYGIKKN